MLIPWTIVENTIILEGKNFQPFTEILSRVDKGNDQQRIQKTLKELAGNKTKAAKALGTSRKTLYELMGKDRSLKE